MSFRGSIVGYPKTDRRIVGDNEAVPHKENRINVKRREGQRIKIDLLMAT
jgi:hypothetical protein